MKKLFTLSVMLFTLVWTANAQTQKGNILVGAQVLNFGANFQSGATAFTLNLSPQAGFFINDNFALGPIINFGWNNLNDVDAFNYGIGAFARKYFGGEAAGAPFKPHQQFFGEINAGFQGISVDGSNTNGLGLGIGPGLAFFLTPHISLEALLKYNLVLGFGNATTTNNIGLNLGFQIYLPGKKAREMMGK